MSCEVFLERVLTRFIVGFWEQLRSWRREGGGEGEGGRGRGRKRGERERGREGEREGGKGRGGMECNWERYFQPDNYTNIHNNTQHHVMGSVHIVQ